MKRIFFLIGYLLNITSLLAAPFSLDRTCLPKQSSNPENQCYQELNFGCGCGGGGGADSGEIPPDDLD